MHLEKGVNRIDDEQITLLKSEKRIRIQRKSNPGRSNLKQNSAATVRYQT